MSATCNCLTQLARRNHAMWGKPLKSRHSVYSHSIFWYKILILRDMSNWSHGTWWNWSHYCLADFAATHDCRTHCRTFQFPDLLQNWYRNVPRNWCTLHSPPFSDGFRWTFTGPCQFQRTQRTVHWTSNGFRRTWPNSAACPVQVRWKSGEVTLKQKIVGLAGLASPMDFRWTSVGLLMVLKGEKGKNMTSPQSTGLPPDFQCINSLSWNKRFIFI